MISSISRLQDKLSEIIESSIQRNSRGMYSLNITAISDASSYIKSFSKLPESNPTTPQKSSIFFTGDNKTQKIMTSNETRLTVAITDTIISEGLSLNIYQKPKFMNVLDLTITVSKRYQPPNRKLISKDIFCVIYDQKMKRNLGLIKKGSDTFGLLFLGECATISRIPIFNILVSGGNPTVAAL